MPGLIGCSIAGDVKRHPFPLVLWEIRERAAPHLEHDGDLGRFPQPEGKDRRLRKNWHRSLLFSTDNTYHNISFAIETRAEATECWGKMPSYLVTYDLRRGDSSEYTDLIDAIKSYGTWARITESSWALVSDSDAKEIRDYLERFLKPNDSLLVLKSGGVAAWRNVRARNEWLKKWL